MSDTEKTSHVAEKRSVRSRTDSLWMSIICVYETAAMCSFDTIALRDHAARWPGVSVLGNIFNKL